MPKQPTLFDLIGRKPTCIECGRLFRPDRAGQRLCSARCGTRYYGYPSPEYPFAKETLNPAFVARELSQWEAMQ